MKNKFTSYLEENSLNFPKVIYQVTWGSSFRNFTNVYGLRSGSKNFPMLLQKCIIIVTRKELLWVLSDPVCMNSFCLPLHWYHLQRGLLQWWLLRWGNRVPDPTHHGVYQTSKNFQALILQPDFICLKNGAENLKQE